ncbi:hypothetical protein LG634_24795 [Streptomyces bambusae]|uniref:hypothetical protein n=1 Tax=Streptomyces bambusae TaxID=1550616 RepID=UPI001CFC613F|nr:hypothetical protein [Streptomyces bambusae]MCB5168032.1 hypothetical protein [Streptomyces bambusae]
MPTRRFTLDELAALGVPPDSPDDIQYDPDLLADEYVATLKYTAQRRCIFLSGTTAYAVEYEAPIDTGDYEVGDGGPPNHGWYGDTVEAVEVEQRPVTVMQWLPVPDPTT